MGHTFSDLLIHVVFSTKNRRPIIGHTFRDRLYEYMGGIARKEIGSAVRIGGTEDHVHGLRRLRPDVSVAHAMNRWKSLSSSWANKTLGSKERFEWQAGYGAFTVSRSNVDAVMAYIDRQAEHHRKLTFKEELMALLKRHGVEYDPQRVFE